MSSSARYDTSTNPFQKEYAENALLQKGFNLQIIEDAVDYILRKLPDAVTRPISIADLCCGDGGATLELFKQLNKKQIKVKRIVGFDISSEQIQRAKKHSESDQRLEFHLSNVETLQHNEEFDVVISLFGLHWIEDITCMSHTISLLLKPNGLVIYFVPLEKNVFFILRETLMQTPEWRTHFNQFSISPFRDSALPYLTSFCTHFTAENTEGIQGDQPVYFTEEDFIRFLSSWMQEVRYLQKSEKTAPYLQTLIKNIKPSNEMTVDVTPVAINGELRIRFLEKFFWFHGVKKSTSNLDEEKSIPESEHSVNLRDDLSPTGLPRLSHSPPRNDV